MAPAKPKSKAPAKPAAPSPLQFFVDPRLELDGVIELLAYDLTQGQPGKAAATDFMCPDIAYVREARKWFAKHAKHPAVVRRAEPRFRAFDMGQRGQGLMRLSPLPALEPSTQISISFLAHYVGGEEHLAKFLQDMRDFARDADFDGFFKTHVGLLDADLAKMKSEIEELDYIGKLETYTGLPFVGRYAFVLSPFLQSDTGANIVQRGEDGLADIISVLGPITLGEKDAPLTCTYLRLHGRAWHEAAHGVLDNVTELFAEDIAAKQPPAREPSREYQNWMHHCREHFVRTAMLRMLAREISVPVADHELQHEEDCGLPFLRDFRKSTIEEYEAEGGREKYPTFADFYPRLLDVLPSPPKGSGSRPLDREGDPYRDWVVENAMPFYTDAQRKRALWYVDLMLERSKNPGLLLKRACLRRLLGMKDEAFADAKAVLALRPGDAGAKQVLEGPDPRSGGQSSQPVGKAPPGRENAYERPAELKKLNDEGVKAFLKKDYAGALKKFEAALKAEPEDAETLVNAAAAWSESGKADKALAAYEKAIAKSLEIPSPQTRAMAAEALSSRATLHERAKRVAEAKADLNRALQLAPHEWDKRAAAEKRLKGLG